MTRLVVNEVKKMKWYIPFSQSFEYMIDEYDDLSEELKEELQKIYAKEKLQKFFGPLSLVVSFVILSFLVRNIESVFPDLIFIAMVFGVLTIVVIDWILGQSINLKIEERLVLKYQKSPTKIKQIFLKKDREEAKQRRKDIWNKLLRNG